MNPTPAAASNGQARDRGPHDPPTQGSIALAALFGALLSWCCPPRPPARTRCWIARPRRRQRRGQLPSEVVLTFSEPVRIVADKIRVTAPDGSRADVGKPSPRTQTAHPAQPGGPKGTYLVSYRVISADSHPVSGGFTTPTVRSPPCPAPATRAPASRPTPGDGRDVRRPLLGFAGLVLLVGPALVLFALWPRRLSARGPGGWHDGRPACTRSRGLGVVPADSVHVRHGLFDVSSTATREVLGHSVRAPRTWSASRARSPSRSCSDP